MSDKTTMLRETGEAFSDLRAMFDWLTEEQASRVWLGVLSVRETLIHIREHTVRNRTGARLGLCKRPRGFAWHVTSGRLAPSGD